MNLNDLNRLDFATFNKHVLEVFNLEHAGDKNEDVALLLLHMFGNQVHGQLKCLLLYSDIFIYSVLWDELIILDIIRKELSHLVLIFIRQNDGLGLFVALSFKIYFRAQLGVILLSIPITPPVPFLDFPVCDNRLEKLLCFNMGWEVVGELHGIDGRRHDDNFGILFIAAI